MPRQLRTPHQHRRRPHRFTLVLALLVAPGFAKIATAAAPVYQGTFTSPGLCSPRGVGLSPAGDVFVGSDCVDLHHMERFTSAGALAGTWTFGPGFAGAPNGVALDGSGNVFVTDTEVGSVRKFTSSGALITVFGTLSQPVDVAVDGAGDVFVVELNGRRVQKFTNGGSFLTTFGSAGTAPGQFQSPVGIAVDASGRVYVADADRGRILRFLANGTFDMEFASPVGSCDVAVGPDGNLYVIRYDINQVRQYSSSGVLLQSFSSPNGLSIAWRIAIGPTGALYITEQDNHRVTKFQLDMATSATRTTFARVKALYR